MTATESKRKTQARNVPLVGVGLAKPWAMRSADNVKELYAWVRAAILNGRIGAGEPISQARLAAEFGVSRTPLREALRMLQAEGLIVGELNQRMRVASMTASGIDSLYATRIVLETFGVSVTVPRFSKEEISRLQQTLKYMNAHNWSGDRAAWEVQHNAFHGFLVMHVGTVFGSTLLEMISNFQLRAERYRRIYVSDDPKGSIVAARDHACIVDAVVARQAGQAILALAEHLARTAKLVLAHHAPGFEPKAVENALSLVAAKAASEDPGKLLFAAQQQPLLVIDPNGDVTLQP